jgi:putative ABC transport system permease protein
MGRILLLCRLAGRDLRRRPAQAALMLLAIMAATTTLTLALALHGVTSQPYQQTRAATAGPDVVAGLSSGPHGPRVQRNAGPQPAQVQALVHAPGVTGHSGPYPVIGVILRVRGISTVAEAEGRNQAPASIDQPKLTSGSWVRSGGVVIERTYADALGVRAGDRITLNGRPFTVSGIAVTAASPPYPNLCYTECAFSLSQQVTQEQQARPGLIWLTQADVRSLATAPLSFLLNLRLKDPASAQAFASAYDSGNPGIAAPSLTSWQAVRTADGLLVTDEQQVLLPGSWLLGLLAVASVAVLVGGRMAEQTRRVGLLKAVGSTPGLVAAVLLAENLFLSLAAAAAGLAAGWLAAPLLTSPGAGLVGVPGAPSLSLSTVELVVAVALAVALAATLVPAIRAARTSTVAALADTARPPRRRALLIAVSARLPVPLLLGLRLAGRRPRRFVLSTASIALLVTTLVTVLAFHTTAGQPRFRQPSGMSNPVIDRDSQVLLVLTVVLVVLAAINAIFTAWTTALDARHQLAVARSLGATPQQVSTGLSAAQLLAAVPGAIVGIPAGIALFSAASHAGTVTIPPAGWLLAAVLGTLLVLAGLTTIPARISARRPVAEILQSETA